MLSSLIGALTARRIVQAFTLFHMIGYEIPLIRIVAASTGASPLIVTKLLLVVKLLGLVILKVLASSAATVDKMLVTREAMSPLTAAPGDVGVMPLAT